MPVVIFGENPGHRPELASFAEKAYKRAIDALPAKGVTNQIRFGQQPIFDANYSHLTIQKLMAYHKLMAKLHPNTLFLDSFMFSSIAWHNIENGSRMPRETFQRYIGFISSTLLVYTHHALVQSKLLDNFLKQHKKCIGINISYTPGSTMFDSHIGIYAAMQSRRPFLIEETIKIPKKSLASENNTLDKVVETPILVKAEDTITVRGSASDILFVDVEGEFWDVDDYEPEEDEQEEEDTEE